MLKKITGLHVMALMLLGAPVSPVHATEWIDCNGNNVWAGLLISSEDDHVVDFQVSSSGVFFSDIHFPYTKVSISSRKAFLRGKITLIGDVALVVEGQKGVLTVPGGDNELTCDWSAWE